ncbi:unnamed protein product [Cercospora beticola]|nr:unnamed protein product [Cercospora beticola]
MHLVFSGGSEPVMITLCSHERMRGSAYWTPAGTTGRHASILITHSMSDLPRPLISRDILLSLTLGLSSPVLPCMCARLRRTGFDWMRTGKFITCFAPHVEQRRASLHSKPKLVQSAEGSRCNQIMTGFLGDKRTHRQLPPSKYDPTWTKQDKIKQSCHHLVHFLVAQTISSLES